MTERELAGAALLLVVAAIGAVAVPWWTLGAAVLAAAVVRRPVAVVVALTLVVSARAASAEAGLDRPAGPVAGVATLVGDPEVRFDEIVVDVSVDGSRLRAEVPRAAALALESAGVGDHVRLVGRVSPLRAPWAWRASRHLCGAWHVSRAGAVQAGAWWWRAAGGFRSSVAAGAASLDGDQRALFSGIVVGDDRAQSDLQRHRFRASGLAHLMAVSGQNVAFALLAASPLLGRLRLRWRWAGSILVLVGFVLVTRAEPSVLRAAVMAGVAATTAWSGRWASAMRTLLVAVVLLVAVDPMLVWSVGFRLSVAASAALVVGAGPLAERIAGPRWFAEIAAASLAATVGTAPMIVGLAGSVPVVGLAANVVAVPVAGWLMVWGLVASPIGGVVGGPIARILAVPSRAMVGWVDGVASIGADARWPRWGPLGVAGVVAVGVAGLLASRRTRSGRVRPGAVVLGLLGAVAAVADLVIAPPGGRLVAADGVRMWRRGGATVVALDAAATPRAALDAVVRHRIAAVDLVVVTGGGLRSSGVVALLREVAPVGTVLAADPTVVRDARPLAVGVLRVGGVALEVARREGRWRVSERAPPQFSTATRPDVRSTPDEVVGGRR